MRKFAGEAKLSQISSHVLTSSIRFHDHLELQLGTRQNNPVKTALAVLMSGSLHKTLFTPPYGRDDLCIPVAPSPRPNEANFIVSLTYKQAATTTNLQTCVLIRLSFLRYSVTKWNFSDNTSVVSLEASH